MSSRLIGAILTACGVALAAPGLTVACSDDGADDQAGGGGAGGGAAGGAGEDSGLPPDCTTEDPGAATATCGDVQQSDEPALDDAIYAVSYVYGDENRQKEKDPENVWKYLGFDIDGQATDGSSSEHCTPVEGADADVVKTDGDGGIDNAFLKSIAPIIATPSPDWVDRWNMGLGTGGSTIAVRLPGLELPPSRSSGGGGPGAPLEGLGYTTVRLCEKLVQPEAGPEAGPDWEPLLLPVDRASLCNGKLDTPLWRAPDGTLQGDEWTSGVIEEVFIVIPFNDASLRVRLRQARMQLTLSADRREVTLGSVGGVVATDELLAQLDEIKGAISALACTFPSVFEEYMSRVRKASDIMTDGTQQVGKTCDAISVGLGFDARLAKLGPTVQLPPVGDTCADSGG